MIKRLSLLLIALTLPATLWAAVNTPAPSASPAREVMVIDINGPITPISAEYIIENIKAANKENLQGLVLELDTPGGLLDSTRDIIKEMLASSTPVIVYVSPSGARAASAGAFITIAAHVAAMSPESNIGAAHPVNAGGDKMDEVMKDKVTNDSAAYIRSIAERRGRNTQWAEDAVRKSVSITAEEALKLKVIDLISKDLGSLMNSLDGRVVETAGGKKTLATKAAKITRVERGLRYKILDIISNPNVAYILMILGFYGLFFELSNPGAMFPGIVGGICIILAFYAFQTLPVNYAGVMLILLAVVLFILEAKIVSHGALGLGGVISMVLGSLMLFETNMEAPVVRVSLSLIVSTTITTALLFIFVVRKVLQAHKSRPVTGTEGLVGQTAEALGEIDAKDGGQVFIKGEIWSAQTEAGESLPKGTRVTVVSMEGLRLKVRKTEGG